jgi:hypothetical protein
MVNFGFYAIMAAGLAITIILYKLYDESRSKSYDVKLPQYRSQPVVVTTFGLRVVKKARPIGNNKFHVTYDNGYSPVYVMGDKYSDLVPVDTHQNILGKDRPIFIERDKLLSMAYTYEDASTRKLLKNKLTSLLESVKNEDYSVEQTMNIFKEVKEISLELGKAPKAYTEISDEQTKNIDRRTKHESDLRKLEAGQEGKIQRRTDQTIDIARAFAKGAKSEHRN